MQRSLTISKLDAAKRQLETYVRLYFHSGDPVAMHTLASAAFGIIRDLNKNRGGTPTIQEQIFEKVRPEYAKLFREKLNEAQNFFKHADRDHHSTLEFNPDLTEFFAMDACFKYTELTGEQPVLFAIFSSWMMMTHQDIFVLPDDQKTKVSKAANTLLSGGRTAYFNDMLPVTMKSGF